MLRFLMGVAVGALGYWAYEQNRAPSPWPNTAWSDDTAAPSTASQSSPILRPTAQEVAGRPAEPIPS